MNSKIEKSLQERKFEKTIGRSRSEGKERGSCFSQIYLLYKTNGPISWSTGAPIYLGNTMRTKF